MCVEEGRSQDRSQMANVRIPNKTRCYQVYEVVEKGITDNALLIPCTDYTCNISTTRKRFAAHAEQREQFNHASF